MQNIQDYLDEKYQGLKYKNAIYDRRTNKLCICFLYSSGLFSNETADIDKLKRDLINDLNLPELEIKLEKSTLTADVIATHLYMDIKNKIPSLARTLNMSDINVKSMGGKDISVTIALPDVTKKYAEETEKSREIKAILEKQYFCNASVGFVDKGTLDDNSNAIEKHREFMQSSQTPTQNIVYNLTNKINVVGKNNYSTAIDFTSVKEPIKDIVICGQVKFVEQRKFNKKIVKDGVETTEERPYFTISISERGKIMYVSIFCRAEDVESLSKLKAGDKVAMRGQFKEYQGKLSFTANEMCLCEFETYEDKIIYKSVNKDYHIVTPEPFVDNTQVDIFGENEIKNDKMKGEYVVFDIETSGLSPETDEIIEIGAVKIQDDKIVSTFSVLIKPSFPVSEEITNLTGISNEMLENCESINNVMPDFYKYCHGATLVGHNLEDFDFKFVDKTAKKLLYNFDNPRMDTLIMARNTVRGVSNYKLGTLVNHFNIPLVNAHRAWADALATAKLFIKIY
ncbi:MAG: PolC-type DNA polymerase III [Clostridia bacterium]